MPGNGRNCQSRWIPYKDVVAFDVNQRFEEPINNIEQNEQGTRSTETIEAEAGKLLKQHQNLIERESENVGSDQTKRGGCQRKSSRRAKVKKVGNASS